MTPIIIFIDSKTETKTGEFYGFSFMSTLCRKKFHFAGKTVSKLKKSRSEENQPREEDLDFGVINALL